jgi:alpha-tubulin suppressor-like RCC1 family protein
MKKTAKIPLGRRCKISFYRSLMMTWALLLALAGIAHAVTPWYASGSSHTLLLHPDGTVWAIGNNNHGQLGNGSSSESHDPVQVDGLYSAMAVAAGGAHSVALQKDGSVWTWGYNGNGQLGNGTRSSSDLPVQVKGLTDIVAIAAGQSHVAALKKDGTVWAWGSNYSGQLGKEGTSISTTPVKVPDLEGVAAIASGAYHVAALKMDGTVWAWGLNGSGQLGNGTCISSHVPSLVTGLNGVVAIASGKHHMVALQSSGTVVAWGSNSASQLGTGSYATESVHPVEVAGLDGVVDLVAKINHTYALMRDGTVMAWGDSGSGQWGNGFLMNGSATPVQMRGVSTQIAAAAVGNPETIVKSSGMLTAAASHLLRQ